MADNTILSAATGTGDLIRTVHKSTYKTPVSLIDISGASTLAEKVIGDSTHYMPVSIRSIIGTTVPVSGSVSITGSVSVSGSTISVTGSTIAATLVDEAGETVINSTENAVYVDLIGGSSISVTNAGTFAVQLTTASTVSVNGTVTISPTTLSVTNAGTFAVQLTTASTVSVNGTVTISPTTLSVTNAAADDAVFTPGTGIGTPVMGLVTSDEVSTGDVGVLSMTTGRQLKVTLYDSTGGELVNVSTLSVSNSGTFAVQVDDFTTDISLRVDGSQEDSGVFTPTTGKGVAMMGLVTSDVVSTGDVGVLGMTLNRQLKVTLYSSTGVEQSVGGGTQYTIGSSGSTGDTVTLAGAIRRDAAATLADTTADITALQVDADGRLWANASGSTLNAAQSGTWNVGGLPLTSGGCSIHNHLGTTVFHTTTVKVTGGQVYGISAFNSGAAPVYLKLYNTTAAPTTALTAAYRALIPASTDGAGFVHNFNPGVEFSTGIGYTITGGSILDGDTAAPSTLLSAGSFTMNLLYK